MTIAIIILSVLAIGFAIAFGILYNDVATLRRDFDNYKGKVAQGVADLQLLIEDAKKTPATVQLGGINAAYDQASKTLVFDGSLVATGDIIAGVRPAKED